MGDGFRSTWLLDCLSCSEQSQKSCVLKRSGLGSQKPASTKIAPKFSESVTQTQHFDHNLFCHNSCTRRTMEPVGSAKNTKKTKKRSREEDQQQPQETKKPRGFGISKEQVEKMHPWFKDPCDLCGSKNSDGTLIDSAFFASSSSSSSSSSSAPKSGACWL